MTRMALGFKRRRLNSQPTMANYLDNAANDPCRPATAQEKESWNGFCELESEPVIAITGNRFPCLC